MHDLIRDAVSPHPLVSLSVKMFFSKRWLVLLFPLWGSWKLKFLKCSCIYLDFRTFLYFGTYEEPYYCCFIWNFNLFHENFSVGLAKEHVYVYSFEWFLRYFFCVVKIVWQNMFFPSGGRKVWFFLTRCEYKFKNLIQINFFLSERFFFLFGGGGRGASVSHGGKFSYCLKINN